MESSKSLSLHQWIQISLGDKGMPVYICTPTLGKPKAAIVVVQEVFGVNSHIRNVTERLAQAGYLALAPDLYHRQGARFTAEYGDIPSAMERAHAMSEEQALADIDRVIATLDGGLKVGVVGFCMGGRIAFQASFNGRVSGAVSLYGTQLADTAKRWASQVQCPLLFYFGGEDTHIPPAEIALLESALKAAGKAFETKVFEGAGHGFFCEERGAFRPEAARQAWEGALAFFGRTLV